MQEVKGIIVEINGRFIKFQKGSVEFNERGNLLRGCLSATERLLTANDYRLIFRDNVRFNAQQKVIKGFLAEPQKVLYKGRTRKIDGFMQFTEEIIPTMERKKEQHFCPIDISLKTATRSEVKKPQRKYSVKFKRKVINKEPLLLFRTAKKGIA